jgi:hypothetical protein
MSLEKLNQRINSMPIIVEMPLNDKISFLLEKNQCRNRELLIHFYTGMELKTIAEMYVECYYDTDPWDGDYVSSRCHGLFDAYSKYKSDNQFLSRGDAKIALRSDGVLETYITHEGHVLTITIRELILNYEGNNEFIEWLKLKSKSI